MKGSGREESAYKSVKWSGADSKGSAIEEEADTAEGADARSETQMATATASGTQNRGAGEHPEIIAAGGSETGNATYAATNKEREGGCHGARSGVRESVSGQRETPAG